ncbi:RNA polymerase sigma factor SigF OS=Streptomyces microflavus OX=1919 GN=G3I39_41825 PE=4 SV=1 [Streptomyces microflavus]
MRFGAEMTQARSARSWASPRSHVSRLLTRIVKQLRKGMSVEA